MKKLISFIAILLIIASTSNLFAQKEKMDIIYLKDGGIYKGKIIVQTNDYIKIKTDNGTYNPPLHNIRKIAQDGDSLENADNQIPTDIINIIDVQLSKIKLAKDSNSLGNRDNQLKEENLIRNNFQSQTIPYRNPGIATFMSLLIPGGGQFYNTQSAKGIGFFLWGAGSASLLTYSAFGGFENNNETIAILSGISYLACWILSMLDAERTAKYINDGYLATFNLGNNKTLALNPDIRLVNSNSNYIKNNSILSYGINFKLSF